MDHIHIRGARTHNLKNISLTLPRDRLVVITGLSGSGKSSLAFDTLYAEGQRRYVESLSAYARQFLSLMGKPDVDAIEGLSPAIAIEQKATSHNPRSTVGTVTEIHDYLRLLYARVGTPWCCGAPIQSQSIAQMVDSLIALPEGQRLMILAPVLRDRKGSHEELISGLRARGLIRARVDGELLELDAIPNLDPKRKHRIEAVIDRLVLREDSATRLAESLETALRLADDQAIVVLMGPDLEEERLFSAQHACTQCGRSFPPLEPRLFSFNNPAGACPRCDGLGEITFFDPKLLIPNPALSLADGAIVPWSRRHPEQHTPMLMALAEHLDFSLYTPWQELPQAVQDILLHGSHAPIPLRQGRKTTPQRFEGIIPSLERRLRETQSSLIREEILRYMGRLRCPVCHGSRLREEARMVRVGQLAIHEASALSIAEAYSYFDTLGLEGKDAVIAERILKEITSRLRFLVDVGLNYLSLDRSAETLSGGEAQRIRLASQIGAGLVGVMYVLDEPSIGLHQRDNDRLLGTLKHLRDLGNTVIVVEHDEDAIRAADYVVDMGPAAGLHGGEVVAQGHPEAIRQNPQSLTGRYLSGELCIAVPTRRRQARPEQWLRLKGARGNNLQDVQLELPLGLLTCITGVSGSGKSTLINDTLYPACARSLMGSSATPAPYDALEGLEHLDKIIAIDQSPIGRTPRSNPATYTGLFTPIRELFAATAEARARGYGPGRFSFNVQGGRCEACEGDGVLRVEMHFLPDIYVDCDVCGGKRYKRETLDVQYKGKSIHDVLQMTIEEARGFFDPVPAVARKLQTLLDVGLGYLRLGQSATTLSGGEAQRVKLAKELSRRDTGRTLYLLDEPTTGLHFHDIAQLLEVLQKLVDAGNTVVVIEHNLDVIKTADWIVDLGPEGGNGGGRIVAVGTPEAIAGNAHSHTGRYLARHLGQALAR
ncbi:excinuclease ABC subunit UvrA [Acidithiobacillus caldus]|jgi:excinuclease ABC subunit A|uniref:UvrABC system protein A n=4 Tax=Acidithiobacillus caldus TaxID=33059 RepID=F9ZMD4_ACICS|nr:excinuclease ABC subunit UvrA [Acidithiobacillus caldus]AEK57283.1 Excinuclease ABC subunit A [Acidithiobacillus caldus SM-1]AIA54528.1 Excinuclease ABC subunit A [Acidithiobacillus caldus ATCC 51756]AUW32038.1 excinuclease ABC subunit UvrA [Acidithiobacillus caldus]MBU2730076.1 excinuclease ABC subunit UvrA [Acidithiobacillus caldus]MBU2734816.1 excinuclease ABC subunit UvrA [Acidithiobacillus caldus ATCC 51756]